MPEKDDAFYNISTVDLIIITVVLLFSFSYIFSMMTGNSGNPKGLKTACVYHENKLLREITLDKDMVAPILNGRMSLEVKKGRIKVASSDCPHHVCMNMGWAGYGGQTLVCVPNKVIVEIKSSGRSLVDGISY